MKQTSDLTLESIYQKERTINQEITKEKLLGSILENEETEIPVVVKVITGLGAWISAFFLSLFVILTIYVGFEGGFFIIGLIFMVTAVVLTKKHKNIFVEQFTLALFLCGNGLVLVEFMIERRDDFLELSVIQLVIVALVYKIYENKIYRFLGPVFILSLFMIYLKGSRNYLIHFVIFIEYILFLYFFIHNKINDTNKPLAFSVAFLLPLTIIYTQSVNVAQSKLFSGIGFLRGYHFDNLLPSSAICSVLTLYLLFKITNHRKKEFWFIITSISVLLLGLFTNPGIIISIALLVTGYSKREKILMVFAYAFFPVFIFYYYYSININLAHKAYIIAGSGLVLILVRQLIKTFQPEVLK
ncbi:MAG: DUF4401 domain-containing protein [Desulfobacterales bacterium]|nr:DUF4401 domain-containing protein [Desulfobacterales bacterium]